MAENEIYLTYQWLDEKGKYLAVISKGSPQMGDENVTVLTLEVFDKVSEIKEWHLKMLEEKPWETRQ